jgi:hypothetical protein
MGCSRHVFCVVVIVLLGSAGAGATPYWMAWEGVGATAALPEQCGWSRNWGNWQGQFQGPGAQRTLENGILTYDSLYDAGVYDLAYIDRVIDPGPGEMLDVEWRLNVERVVGPFDPSVSVAGDGAWLVGFVFSESAIMSVFEGYAATSIAPGIVYDYRLTSWDMRSYDLYTDGVLARVGSFWHGVSHSHVGWGDSTQGAASLHRWDYFRIGVVPEPAPLIGAVLACCVGRRR